MERINQMNKGFTLIEIIMVIAIILALVGIAVSVYQKQTSDLQKQICLTNCRQLQKAYETKLFLEGIEHRDEVFTQFMDTWGQTICPSDGGIHYDHGKLYCSVHSHDVEDADEDEAGGVPFLWKTPIFLERVGCSRVYFMCACENKR